MNDSVTHRTPDPRDASASENFNAEWSFMLWTFISLMTTLSNNLTCTSGIFTQHEQILAGWCDSLHYRKDRRR